MREKLDAGKKKNKDAKAGKKQVPVEESEEDEVEEDSDGELDQVENIQCAYRVDFNS